MPWHPPCALSNLIVTNLSSCQRIDFSIFDCFFLLRPTAKLFAFLRSCVISNTFATGFFTRCFFHLAVQFSRYRMKCVSRLRFLLPLRSLLSSAFASAFRSRFPLLSLRSFFVCHTFLFSPDCAFALHLHPENRTVNQLTLLASACILSKIVDLLGQALGLLVSVSYTHYCASTSDLSTT